MADSAQVAESFFDAWTTKDFIRARELLHDDVSFQGPIDTFRDADSYLASLQQLSGIVTGVDKQKVFVDGDDVCVIYDLKTAPVPNSRTCEWYRVSAGKSLRSGSSSTPGRSPRCSRRDRGSYLSRPTLVITMTADG